MANAEDELSVEGLMGYIHAHGGKVLNIDLVAHYSRFLKDPKNKAANKKKFSQIVNEVATLKTIEGTKYLVLKKKYKKEVGKLTFQPPPVDEYGSEEFALDEDPVRVRSRKVAVHSTNGVHRDEVSLPTDVRENENQINNELERNGNNVFEEFNKEFERTAVKRIVHDSNVEQNERIPDTVPSVEERQDLQEVRSFPSTDQIIVPSMSFTSEDETKEKSMEDDGSIPVSRPALDTSSQIESVRKVASTFNEEEQRKSIENSSMKVADSSSPTEVKRMTREAENHEEDDEPPRWAEDDSIHNSDSNSHHHVPPKLDALERKWMLACAYGKIPELNELLKQDPTLITKRDFISFTVMHWGAKLGKKEMIRMAINGGLDVNMRTQGGYTALHIAAMHNKEAIMQLLISDFGANIEIRDYSGRKPHHHLKLNASSYIKNLIKGGAPDPDERHSAKPAEDQLKKRQSKVGTFFRSQLRNSFRSSFRIWGSADDLDTGRLRTSDQTPPKTPPSSPRMRSKSAQHDRPTKDNHLMPPPHPFHHRKSKKKAGRRSRSPGSSNIYHDGETGRNISQ